MNSYNKQRVGIYAGSFDPFTIGHLNIATQAKKIFDQVIIARGKNPAKPPHLNKLPEDTLITLGFDVYTYTSLLPDYIKSWEPTCDVTLIRGLRSGYDLNEEQNLLAFLREMHPKVKVIYIICDVKYQHISSSALKGIQQFSQEEYLKYIVQ